MTQEDKQLLLRDICVRLPYGVKVRLVYDENTIEVREMGIGSLHDIIFKNVNGLPYLRPMSSMTEEEEREYWRIYDICSADMNFIKLFDWLNEHHFDYRGLIEMGLALEAPEGMYKNE